MTLLGALRIGLFLIGWTVPGLAAAAAACVMAKWQGTTLDYVLVHGKAHAVEAQEEAQRLLGERGYGRYGPNVDVRHPQAATALPSGQAVVLKSTYKNWRGRERTSYGCGFAAQSRDEALWAALRDLQAHAWGWTPDRDGYEIVEQLHFDAADTSNARR